MRKLIGPRCDREIKLGERDSESFAANEAQMWIVKEGAERFVIGQSILFDSPPHLRSVILSGVVPLEWDGKGLYLHQMKMDVFGGDRTFMRDLVFQGSYHPYRYDRMLRYKVLWTLGVLSKALGFANTDGLMGYLGDPFEGSLLIWAPFRVCKTCMVEYPTDEELKNHDCIRRTVFGRGSQLDRDDSFPC